VRAAGVEDAPRGNPPFAGGRLHDAPGRQVSLAWASSISSIRVTEAELPLSIEKMVIIGTAITGMEAALAAIAKSSPTRTPVAALTPPRLGLSLGAQLTLNFVMVTRGLHGMIIAIDGLEQEELTRARSRDQAPARFATVLPSVLAAPETLRPSIVRAFSDPAQKFLLTDSLRLHPLDERDAAFEAQILDWATRFGLPV